MLFGIIYKLLTKSFINKQLLVERLLQRLKRCECNLTFLMKCRYVSVYPKFVRYKNFKNKPYKVKSRYYCRILLDEITTKNRSI